MSVTDATPAELSKEARTLWAAALALARAAAGVSPLEYTPDLPPLLFFTDPARTPDPWVAAARLPRGAAVVYRHFGLGGAEARAERLREVTARRGVKLLIGLDVDLAQAVGADGVHLPQHARAQAAALKARRPDWLVTGAAHVETGEDTAPVVGLDALVLSPVFRTDSPSRPRPCLGPRGLADAARRSSLPVYALGGIDAGNVELLAGTGACGIAGVGAFSRAFGG